LSLKAIFHTLKERGTKLCDWLGSAEEADSAVEDEGIQPQTGDWAVNSQTLNWTAEAD
jgi:hypothetical protein